MIISFLHNEKYDEDIYISLHAEQVYSEYNFNAEIFEQLKNDEEFIREYERGIYSITLTYSTLRNIINNIEEYIDKFAPNSKYLFLDFKNIKAIQNNLDIYISTIQNKIRSKNIMLVAINVNKGIVNYIDNVLTKVGEKINFQDFDDESIYNLSNDIKIDNILNKVKGKENLDSYINEIFEAAFVGKLKLYSDDIAEPLTSTPVYSNKYVNIKKFIEDKSFFLYCLYKLVTKMMQCRLVSENYNDNKDIVIFCHNLNGTYISSVIANLLCIDIIYLNHIGPINKVYNINFENRIDKLKEYIIVTDFICFGTEVTTAKTLIEYSGGRCKGNISIVSCKTVTRKESSEDINRCVLFNITKETNPIPYYIYTDLKEIENEKVKEIENIQEVSNV